MKKVVLAKSYHVISKTDIITRGLRKWLFMFAWEKISSQEPIW